MSEVIECNACGKTAPGNELCYPSTRWYALNVGEAWPLQHFCSKACLINGVLDITAPKKKKTKA